ncbi:hypothetical protein ACX0MV_17675 [Pseudomonas borbori]
MTNDNTYYASTAYSPASIPDQPPSSERSWLRKLGGSRLPWGRTQEVAPESIMTDPTPKSMRFWEEFDKKREEEKAQGTYKKRPMEGVELHGVFDHERFRYALLSKRSHFWMYLCGGAVSFLSQHFFICFYLSCCSYSVV